MKKIVLGLALVLCGCSSLGPQKTDEEIVAERAQSWLNALLDKKVHRAWEFTSPGYRASSTPGAYMKHVAGAGSWKEAEVQHVECEEERCEVRYLITYELPQFGVKNTRPLNSVWIKVNDKWWLYQK